MADHVLSPLAEVGGLFSSASTSTGRSNALQNRVTHVLSASYADLEIRDALGVLDERGVQNSPELRRSLRLDVQEELIQCNGEIVRDFGQVAAQLHRIGAVVASLNSSCVEMRKRVSAAGRETAPMLEDAKTIMADKRSVETKQQLLDAFTAHFVVADEDLAHLASSAEPVNDEFFRVLTRVKKVHGDSQILLGSENERLGLEILEHTSRLLNSAFHKLYRWVQREFKFLDLENPQISAGIRRALRVLAERPSLFQSCLDSFADARETILSDNFYAALTGTPTDPHHPVMGKAIELSAHDPLRYISDMLAWAHSATVSEREALEVLFISDGDEMAKSIQAGIESEPWSRFDGDEPVEPFDGRKALADLVDRDLAGVFRQLGNRAEQVIRSHEDATLAYRISNLVTFYCRLFLPLLGEQSRLLGSLRPLAETALRAFRSTMRDHVASLHTDLIIAPDQLEPPDFLTEALATLRILMQSYDTSVPHATRAERFAGFTPVLREALDPFLAGCETVTARLHIPANHIFALNCLSATQNALATYPFADRSEDLQPRTLEHAEHLTSATHAWFVSESGLKPLIDDLTLPDDLAASYTDPSSLAALAQKLDAFLPTAVEDAKRYLLHLDNSALRRRIVEQAAEYFCEDFEELEALLLRADEMRREVMTHGKVEVVADEGVWLREIFPRTAAEIRVLLS